MDTGFILVAMLSMALVMVWAFFTFAPEFADKKAIRVFNFSVLGAIGIVCTAFSFKAYAYLGASAHASFLPILLFLMNMMIIAVGLLAGFLIRNFFIFR